MAEITRYIGAPYNFIKLPEHVVKKYENISSIPAHDLISDDLLSGEIEYIITPETELFIGGSDGRNFYRNASGKLAVPGSSFRGLVRNNVQILSHSSIGDDVDDYRIMFRKVGGKKEPLKDYYNEILGVKPKTVAKNEGGIKKNISVSVCENVKAGYLFTEDGKNYIIHSAVSSEKDCDNRNYYNIRTDLIKDFRKNEIVYPDGKAVVTDLTSGKYIPFSVEVSYNTDKGKVVSVGKPETFSKKGFLVGSGSMNGKKALYIVPEEDTENVLSISDNAVGSFKKDYKMKEKLLGATVRGISPDDKENFKKYFDLPKKSEKKPVFYIEYNGTIYFGFTPYLRIFYRYSIKDGLPDEHRPAAEGEQPCWDYTKSLFGFSKGNVSFKSRVYFTDAEYEGTEHFEERKLVLGEPKPSSYHDYIEPSKNNAMTYNDEGFRIRGYKQYWLRDKVVPEDVNKGTAKDNVASCFRSLKEKNGIFRGKIRFKNLSSDELGLILYALDLDKNAGFNIGKGKPYGLGRIKVDIEKLVTFENRSMYSTEEFSFAPFKDRTSEIKDYITNFFDVFDSFMQTKDDEKRTKKIRNDFKMMKDTSNLPKVEKIRYMDIGAKEYQSRGTDNVLPSVANIIKGDQTSDVKPAEVKVSNPNFVIKQRGKR